MANTLGIDYAADHKEQELDRGLSITYKGTEYSAIVGIPRSFRTYESDGSGYFESKSLPVSVRICEIGESIAKGEKITYDGAQYRIADIVSDTESGWVLLTCEGLAL